MSNIFSSKFFNWKSNSKNCNFVQFFLFHYLFWLPCLSVHPSFRPSVLFRVSEKLTSKPASVSQNVIDKSCLVYVKSEKYIFWVNLRPLQGWDIAKLYILILSSVFQHLPSVGPKQLCALAHLGCTHKVGT